MQRLRNIERHHVLAEGRLACLSQDNMCAAASGAIGSVEPVKRVAVKLNHQPLLGLARRWAGEHKLTHDGKSSAALFLGESKNWAALA